ncbi:MAG: TolC family protein [Weeksellaceae bacterium]
MKSILILGCIVLSIFVSAQQTSRTMNLQECIDYALENNITVQQTILKEKIAENEIKRSSGNLLPKVSAGVSQSANLYHQSKIKVNSYSTQFDFVQANWTVFDGFRNIHIYDNAVLDQEIANRNVEVLKNDIALNIANTYLQVLFNTALVEIAESQLLLSEKQLEIVTIQYKGGVVPEANIADAKAAVAQDELTLVQRKNSVQSALLQLKSLLQMPVDLPLQVQDVEAERYMAQLELGMTSNVFQQALEIRPEIELRALQVERAANEYEIATAGILPTISLGYGFGTGYTYFKNNPNGDFGKQFTDNLGHAFTLSINVPIFDGYQNKTNIANAQISQENALLDLENEKFQLRQQIETAYLDAMNAKKAYEASLKNVEARTVALDFMQKRYDAGFSNILDFELAKNNWVAAKGNLAQAKYDFLFKVKVLEFYTSNRFELN